MYKHHFDFNLNLAASLIMVYKDIQNIVWDWNGTLLNDVELCYETLNVLLEKRKLNKITRNIYLDRFTFPVYNFYEGLGFDFTREDFTLLSEEYMILYNEGLKRAPLSILAIYALKAMKRRGLLQYVLSAMEEKDLKKSLANKGIKHYFAKIYGNTNQLAEGKIDVAHSLFENEQLVPEDTLLIGDTLHDIEVARAIGCPVVIVSNGHQALSRFKQSKVDVVADLGELIEKHFLR